MFLSPSFPWQINQFELKPYHVDVTKGRIINPPNMPKKHTSLILLIKYTNNKINP